MKSLKRVIAMLMSVLMLVMAVPLNDLEVQASTNGVQEKIDKLRSVYATGTYFTKSGGPASSANGWADSQLTGIPARGGLPAGSTLGVSGTSCWAFATYCFYYIFGHLPSTNVTQVSTPAIGDFLNFGYSHYGIYLGSYNGGYYIYDCNGTDAYNCVVRYQGQWSKTSNVIISRSNRYNQVYGVTTPSVSYATITTGKYYLKNTSTGTYLNVDGGTDANTQNVSVASFTGGTSMQMEVSSATNGYKIRPMCSSSRLVNPYADYVSSGVNVNIYNNVNDSSQWWGFEKVSGGYVIRNMQNQNCVLSLSGSNVIVSTYTGAANQVWALEPYDTYTISYNANGGSGAPSSQTKVHGIAVALSTTKPTRTGYKFLGWSTSSSATSATYASGATYTANGNVTLYAVWEANTYTVTYSANGGTGAPSSQTKTYGVNLTLYAKEPTRSGYKFLGWGTSASATSTTYAPGGTYTKNEGIILYAVWQKSEYVTCFNLNGGTSFGISSIARQAGAPIVFPENEPYKFYCNFLGWSDSQDSLEPQYMPGETVSVLDGDRVFYAVWKEPTKVEEGVGYSVEITNVNTVERFVFTAEASAYYAVYVNYDETPSNYYDSICIEDENGIIYGDNSSGNGYFKYVWLEAGETIYLSCSSMSNKTGLFYKLYIECTPITSMKINAQNLPYATSNRIYSLEYFEPTFILYSKDEIFFEGKLNEMHENLGIGAVDSDLSTKSEWTAGEICDCNVNIGDLSATMSVEVLDSPIKNIDVTVRNSLMENVDKFDDYRYSIYSYDLHFVVTFNNDETVEGDVNTVVSYCGAYLGIDSSENHMQFFDDQSEENIWGVGKHVVTLEYLGYIKTFEVEIIANPVSQIIVKTGVIECAQSDSISTILSNNPIELEIVYDNGATETKTITSDNYYLIGCSVLKSENWAAGRDDNALIITYMEQTVSIQARVKPVDKIIGGEVIWMPYDTTSCIIDSNFTCEGVKIKLTFASGATEIVELPWFMYHGQIIEINGVDYYFDITNYVAEGTRKCYLTVDGVDIQIAELTGTKTIISITYNSIPTSITPIGQEMTFVYSDGTEQIVTTTGYDYSHGGPGFQSGYMATDIGFLINWRWEYEFKEHASINYPGTIPDYDEEEHRIISVIIETFFDNEQSFNGKATSENIDAIILATATYYDFFSDAWTYEIDELTSLIKTLFNIEDIDLTKSTYYSKANNKIVGSERLVADLGRFLSEDIILYDEKENSRVFRLIKEEETLYVEISNEDNKIIFIGNDYSAYEVDYLTITSLPSKMEYFIGDVLDISDISISVTYKDGSVYVLEEGYDISDFDSFISGKQTIVISYQGAIVCFDVVVNRPQLILEYSEMELLVEERLELKVEVISGKQFITWTSSDDSVATVTNGNVTAIAHGTAVITAEFTYNGETYSKTCIVTVNEPLPTVTGLTVVTSPAKATYIAGDALDTTGLSLRVDYDNGTSEIVSEGFEVKGYDSTVVGVQVLEVTYADVTTNFTITVSNPELTLSDSERTMVIGGTVQLRVDTIPTGQTVAWKSSDTSVATVENGLVTAVNSGVTVVSAEFVYGGKTYSKECTITVIASLTSIEIATTPNKTVYQIDEELDTMGLSLRLNYDDGTTKAVTDGFTTYGYDAEKVGTQIVTVYYHGHASTYTVIVEVDENTPQIVVESKKNVAGRTVTVDVILKNNPGIASARLTLDFDTSVLTLIDVTDAGKLGVQCHKAELTSPYTLSWMNDTATENFGYNGTIVTLTFEIAEDVELGDYIIDLSYDYDNYDIWNVNVERVKFVDVDGVISVIDTIIGDVNGDGVVNTLDRMTLARYLANWEAYTVETIDLVAADVNGDGKVNTLDRMVLARHLADWSGYETLPCEM